MIRLDDMRLFAQLAMSGSLTSAARDLGVPKQTLSRRLAGLEQGLGVELARRTTRSVVLTDVGRAYAARCTEVIRLANEANLAASSQLGLVSGTLRITADPTFGEAFLPGLIAEYIRDYCEANVTVVLTSRKVDLLDEGFDVAFRIGPPPDVNHLAATRLGPARLWTVASAQYLAACPAPMTTRDLVNHTCISLAPAGGPDGWPFLIRKKLALVPVAPRIRVNGLTMARQAALASSGLTQLPEFVAGPDVADGRLVRVLERFDPEVGGVHVVYPHSRLLAPKVSEFVARAVDRFRETGTRVAQPVGRT